MSKNDVFSIEPSGFGGAEEKLFGVGRGTEKILGAGGVTALLLTYLIFLSKQHFLNDIFSRWLHETWPLAAEGIIKAELWSSRGEQGALQVDSKVVGNKSTTETVLW